MAHRDCRSATIKSRVTKISLALSPCRDNHPLAATAKMAILIVAVFPSRLSRYTSLTREYLLRTRRAGLAPVGNWTHALGVSKEELQKAIDKVGNSAASVRERTPDFGGSVSLGILA
jgi:hypothetical protein